MSYLTLAEAADYATEKKGFTVTPAMLLRAGVHGVLKICAAFGFGAMYNATKGEEEDFKADLLLIPPKHLQELETEGSARIQRAHGLDGTLYFPLKSRTSEQLRVVLSHLDEFLPHLVSTLPEPQAEAPASVPDPERRLALLRKLGGSATYRRGKWRFTGIAALEASEKGRQRNSQKTIRGDLVEAAQKEADAKRAGFASGLGQR